jgi:hypothetical protein
MHPAVTDGCARCTTITTDTKITKESRRRYLSDASSVRAAFRSRA